MWSLFSQIMIIIWILKCIVTFFSHISMKFTFKFNHVKKGQKSISRLLMDCTLKTKKKNFFEMNSIVVKRFDCLICIIYCGMMIAIKCQLSFISQSKLSDVISFHPSKKSIWVGWVELHFAFFFSRLTRGRWDVRQ